MKTYLKTVSMALASILVATTAFAADEKTHRLDDAWKSALLGEEPILAPQQFAKLNNLAFQAAAVRVCDGFELDQAKFTAALEDATAAAKDDLTPEALDTRQAFILIEFGMRYGLFIAEGEAQDKSFCTNATELKAKADIPNVWE
jgi:hypothetical protein